MSRSASRLSRVGRGAGAVMGRLGRVMGGIGRGAAAVGKVFAGLGKGFTAAFGALGSVTAGFSGLLNVVLAVPTAIVNLANIMVSFAQTAKRLTLDLFLQGDSIADVDSAFKSWTRTMGGAEATLQALQKATSGEVDAISLQRSALQFATRGVELNTTQLSTLFKVVKQITDVTGRDFAQVLEQIAQGFSRGTLSTIAAAVGIENMRRTQIAATLSTDGLQKQFSAAEISALGMSLIMERANEVQRIFGQSADNAGDRSAQFLATIENLRNEILLTVVQSEDLNAALVRIGEFFGAIGFAAEDVGSTLGEKIAAVFARLADQFPQFAVTLQRFVSQLTGVLAFFLTAIGEIARVLGTTILPVLLEIGGASAETQSKVTSALLDTRFTLGLLAVDVRRFGETLRGEADRQQVILNQLEEERVKREELQQQRRRAGSDAQGRAEPIRIQVSMDEAAIQRARRDAADAAEGIIRNQLAERELLLNAQAAAAATT